MHMIGLTIIYENSNWVALGKQQLSKALSYLFDHFLIGSLYLKQLIMIFLLLPPEKPN